MPRSNSVRARVPKAERATIPAEARTRFHCVLWSCVLSRYACALRWTLARAPQARGSAYYLQPRKSPYARCARCSIGRANAALIPAETLKKKVVVR